MFNELFKRYISISAMSVKSALLLVALACYCRWMVSNILLVELEIKALVVLGSQNELVVLVVLEVDD